MNIRIDQITVRRDGPLAEDFELGCGDLNLIYGENESGKSYLVECLIQCLFKTSGSDAKKWSMRDWDPRAEVKISGLSETVTDFKPGKGEKLESLWQPSDEQLPDDLGHLLVVKEGATWLDESSTGDGVGMDLLRRFLSGEGLLDGVEKRISTTLQNASIEDGKILGNQQGEIKNRNKLEAELKLLNTLMCDCDSEYSQGRLVALESKKKQLEDSRSILHRARCFKASSLAAERAKLENSLNQMPPEGDVGAQDQKTIQYSQDKLAVERTESALTGLRNQIDNHSYLLCAIENYERIAANRQNSRGPQMLLPAALLFVIVAIAGGLGSWSAVSVISGVIAASLVAAYLWLSRRARLPDPGADEELQRLGEEFQRRFNEPLADLASLEAMRDKLQSASAVATNRIKELGDARTKLNTDRDAICVTLGKWTGQDVDESRWDECIKSLKDQRGKIKQKVDDLNERLESLAVPKDHYTTDDPGHVWEVAEDERIKEEIAEVDGKIDYAEQGLTILRQRARTACDIEGDPGWEELLHAVRTKRAGLDQEYADVTAEMVAKILVHKVVAEQREDENERIRRRLEDKSIGQWLEHFSGRYVGFSLTDEEQLEVEDSNGNSFPVSILSTGAKEQVYLSLRIGFASLALGDRAGFLLLDDAFQHSDWQRRESLVNQCMSLLERGWQIFYFAMDDHIRDLFIAAGKSIGKGFTRSELASWNAQ